MIKKKEKVMMNLCFLSGKVINQIELKFVYNPKTKSLSKQHTAIVVIELEIESKQVVKAYAYDKIADWIYQNVKQEDIVYMQSKIRNDGIEIVQVEE